MTEKQDMGVVTQADIDLLDAITGGSFGFRPAAKRDRLQIIARFRLASRADHGEAVHNLCIAAGELNIASDGIEAVRSQREAVLTALKALATHPQPSQKGEGDE